MNINVFLLCYNESALIPHTVKHYKMYLPNCIITIYDNESTDNSVELAKSLGCNVISWSSGDIIDDYKYLEIKNECWKNVNSGWIIVADMDEYLCVTESDLLLEMVKGTSILKVQGIDMVGESSTLDLKDIDLQSITKHYNSPSENKNLCFLKDKIHQINYTIGAHHCKPKGRIVYSKTVYINKHMNFLGLEYYVNKSKTRHSRSEKMRNKGIATHYTDNEELTKQFYLNLIQTFNRSP